MVLLRRSLLADDSLKGAAWCTAHSALIDGWLAGLLDGAAGTGVDGVALVAVGGYGRSELCPESDIDVMLVHDRRSDVGEVADRVWYPIWDEAIHLGHSVCTVREALELAADDLDTATALLSARHVAGDRRLSTQLADGGRGQWERKSKRWLTELGGRVELRHELAGEVAFLLEPDLKDGYGGLRDVHALGWAQASRLFLLDDDALRLGDAYGVLLDARVELQRRTRRPGNALVLEEQDAVAVALGDADADALMHRVAEAARRIAWTSDDTWRRIRSSLRGPLGRAATRTRSLGGGVALRDGEVHVDTVPVTSFGPALALRAGLAAAVHHTVIDSESLVRLGAATVVPPEPWPEEVRAPFVELLLTGTPAIRVIEALDQRGVWEAIVPEWRAVRARPQRNPYHRYTVDRHLLETVANAARLAGGVDRPDLLVVAALLHDLGKGFSGDHTEVGVGLARRVGGRMGYPEADLSVLAALVEHHLLLADVATHRDLDDQLTIDRVATTLGSPVLLRLLAALTEADSLATGPSAWGNWKAQLVGQLVERVEHRLAGGELAAVVDDSFPTPAQLARLAAGGRCIEVSDSTLTVINDDRPGMFSRVAGVLALHGLDIIDAAAHSTEDGRALAQFRVHDPVRQAAPWDRVRADVDLALDGRLALHARVSERADRYAHRRLASAGLATTRVSFDDGASAEATVIDVLAADGIGVLYRVTRALLELDLDIRSARAETRGHQAIDAFYVRDAGGAKLGDGPARAEIARAILHSLAE